MNCVTELQSSTLLCDVDESLSRQFLDNLKGYIYYLYLKEITEIIIEDIERKQLIYGHVQRMNDERLPKRAMK